MCRTIVIVFSFLFAFIVPVMAEDARTHKLNIAAPSLATGVLNNPKTQKVNVYLPSQYAHSTKRFPVVYYFHGYGGNEQEAGYLAGDIYDEFIASQKSNEMIIVGINGYNQFGGSFFANSPVTGNWEDFVVNDVVNYIDRHYRTVSTANARGIAGYSMGGYAAINIGFKHADKFKHVFALSPGLVTERGLFAAVKQWKQAGWYTFLDGYAATFAPHLVSQSAKKWHQWNQNDHAVIELWASGFGHIEKKVKDYVVSPHKLNSLRIEYGKHDHFAWIPKGSQHMVSQLKAHNIPVTEHDHQGGHELGEMQAKHILSFFKASFKQPHQTMTLATMH